MNTRFKVVVASRNVMRWLPACLNSIGEQSYTNYDVIVIDDASDPVQAGFIQDYCEKKGWTSVLNLERKGAMYNHVQAIRNFCDPEDVVVFVDGDDRLANETVLQTLDEYYSTGNYDLTYGSYISVPFSKTCEQARPYPEEVIRKRRFRRHTEKYGLHVNHLRTVKAFLAQQLGDENFTMRDGTWFEACTDTALMIPCLELAGPRHAVIPEILYHYNSENPQSDWRTKLNKIREIDKHIYSMEPVA